MEEAIVCFVQERPWLYDSSRSDNKDSGKKLNSWKDLASQLNTDVDTVKKKWRCLRNQFAREKRLKPSGSAATGKKKWQYMELMSFLHPFVNEKKQTHNNFSSVPTQEITFMVQHTEEETGQSQNVRESFQQEEPGQNVTGEGTQVREVEFWQQEPGQNVTGDGTQEEQAVGNRASDIASNWELPQDTPVSLMKTPVLASLTMRNKRKRNTEQILQSIENSDQLLKKLCMEEDEDEHFAQVIKYHLKKFPSVKKLDIQMKLLNLLKDELSQQ